jgi:hypothetical protein
MRIKFEIEGTEVTVDTTASGAEKPGPYQQTAPDGDLPPELAAAVAAGAINGGRAPQAPGSGMTPGTSGEGLSAEDRSGGAAPPGIEGPFPMSTGRSHG